MAIYSYGIHKRDRTMINKINNHIEIGQKKFNRADGVA